MDNPTVSPQSISPCVHMIERDWSCSVCWVHAACCQSSLADQDTPPLSIHLTVVLPSGRGCLLCAAGSWEHVHVPPQTFCRRDADVCVLDSKLSSCDSGPQTSWITSTLSSCRIKEKTLSSISLHDNCLPVTQTAWETEGCCILTSVTAAMINTFTH